MKNWLRNTLFSATVALVAAGITAVCLTKEKTRQDIACNDIKVEFLDTLKFTNAAEIKAAVRRACPEIIGKPIVSIDLGGIEKQLETRACILKCEAWTTDDGKLNISVRQRQAVIKFEMNGREPFYADRSASLFPGRKGYEPKAITVRIDNADMKKRWILNLISFLDFCNKSKEWRGQISDIAASQKGNLSFKTVRGNERIQFGQPERIKTKFETIDTYFTTIAPSHDYSSVNVSYSGQIICK